MPAINTFNTLVATNGSSTGHDFREPTLVYIFHSDVFFGYALPILLTVCSFLLVFLVMDALIRMLLTDEQTTTLHYDASKYLCHKSCPGCIDGLPRCYKASCRRGSASANNDSFSGREKAHPPSYRTFA